MVFAVVGLECVLPVFSEGEDDNVTLTLTAVPEGELTSTQLLMVLAFLGLSCCFVVGAVVYRRSRPTHNIRLPEEPPMDQQLLADTDSRWEHNMRSLSFIHTVSSEGCTLTGILPTGRNVEGPADPAFRTWVKQRTIGRGAYGVVYVGQVRATGDDVAMKEQLAASRTDAEDAHGLLELLSTLHHPYLTDMLDVLYDPDTRRLCVFMEYVQGSSFGEYVRGIGGRLDEGAAAYYLRQVLEAVCFLHANGVVHRDIKGDNVLLSHQGVAKLCDFGSLRKIPPNGVTYVDSNTQVGSPNFMAPEVISVGSGVRAGPAADIYSFGCTVSEVLNEGVPPGRGSPLMQMAETVCHPPRNVVSSVSPVAADFITLCIGKEASERATAAQLLNHPFVARSLLVPPAKNPSKENNGWLTHGEMKRRRLIPPALGRGSFGVVHLAVINGHRKVALKELQLEEGHTGRARVQVESEFELMQSLRHPRIVQYLGHSWRDASCLEIFMEYMSGGSVKCLLRRSSLATSTVVVYTRQVVQGLQYLHTRVPPVAHRDVKADNLLLSAEGDVKLSDFGCSKILSEHTADVSATFGVFGAKTCIGTPLWMAPEVLHRKKGDNAEGTHYGTKCDIWSMACTVIEMLGVIPWQKESSESETEVMKRMLTAQAGETPSLPESSADLRDFLLYCFKPDPATRPSAGDLLAHVALTVPVVEVAE